MLFYFLIFLVCAQSCASTRKLFYNWNPGCFKQSCRLKNRSYTNFLDVYSDLTDERIHMIWSTIDVLSFTLIKTTSTDIIVDWDNLINKSFINNGSSIKFKTTKPIYVFSTFFPTITIQTSVYETDKNILNSSYITSYKTSDIVWDDLRKTIDYNDNIAFLNGYHPTLNMNISLKLSFFTKDERSLDYPHIKHTQNSTQMEVRFFKRTHNQPTLNDSQFMSIEKIEGITAVILQRIVYPNNITNNNQQQIGVDKNLIPQTMPAFEVKRTHFIDDEYTPGIFSYYQLVSKAKAYLQWKPVYFDKIKPSNFRDTNPILISPLDTFVVNPRNLFNDSNIPMAIQLVMRDRVWYNLYTKKIILLNADKNLTIKQRNYENEFFEPLNNDKLLIQCFNLTFMPSSETNAFEEMSQYNQSIIWYALFGVGQIPRDVLSGFIIILLALGFGVPFALAFFTYSHGYFKLVQQNKRKKRLELQNSTKNKQKSAIIVRKYEKLVS